MQNKNHVIKMMAYNFIFSAVVMFYLYMALKVDIENRTDYDQSVGEVILTYYEKNLMFSVICTIIAVVSFSIGVYYIVTLRKKNEEFMRQNSADPIIK